MTQATLIDVQPELGADGENERYTTRETLDWCKRVSGIDEYDLDVAACAEAHCAPRYYTKADDGLSPKRRWFGDVWCNPPFDNIDAWLARAWVAWRNHEARTISMLLPANRTEQPFWQSLVEPLRDLEEKRELNAHFLPGRTRYGCPGNPTGAGIGSPPFASVLLVWKRPWVRKLPIIDVEEERT